MRADLAVGAVSTAIGIYVLWTNVMPLSPGTTELSPWGFVSHFLPRFTQVVFMEIFAYFFLSLYKTGLQKIKYFDNELTNVESKHIALRTAMIRGNEAMITTMVNALAATERNHVLEKNQTTIELEKAKLDRQGTADILNTLKELLNKKDKC